MKKRSLGATLVYALCGFALLVGVTVFTRSAPAEAHMAGLPKCEDACNESKPCDKRCLNDNGDQITCGEYGRCGEPPPPPPPPGGCEPPTISADPNPVAVNSPVRLRVSNPSNDLLDYSFNWSFGDGTHSRDGLEVQHTYTSVAIRTAYWEGWARCQDGSDRFVNTTATVGVFDPTPPPPGRGGGACGASQGTVAKPLRFPRPLVPEPDPCKGQ